MIPLHTHTRTSGFKAEIGELVALSPANLGEVGPHEVVLGIHFLQEEKGKK